MDPVSLTLGILPLLGGAIKAYGTLYKKLKIFRHYSREVHRVRKHLDRQRQFFCNESHLLIRPALEEWTVECMLEDAGHAEWHSKELEAALRSLLGKNYDACLDIIDEIGGVVDELQREMECFDQVEAQRQKARQLNDTKGESLRDTLRRLGGRLKITWDKSKFESSITNLRNSNDDLRRLREQASELQKPKTQLKETQKRLGQEYSDYGTIRRASKALHLALATAWSKPATSCPSAGLRHNVKLFVDAKVKDGVRMDMAVLCYGHESATVNLMRPNLTRFQVRSQVIDWMESGLNTPPRSDDGQQKRRKVRFIDDCTASKDPGSIAASAMLQTPEGSDTQSTQSTQSDDLSGKDICSTLTQERLNPATKSSSGCLGFIDTCCQETFRHSLYQGIDQRRLQAQRLVSMGQALSNPAENLLTVVDQLKLARNLVAAVLKFHSTPWLGQYFALNDLSFFQTGPELPACLQTLHFGTDFINKEGVELQPTPMEGLESTNPSTFMMAAFENARLQYGIRNLTLWSLGAILLQIGRWSKIDSPDDVLTIRKLSSQTPVLGPRYQELTKRCLECDFGYGEDLSKPRLQQAVYENLVCELSDMIKSLDISA